jgi:hypothetical protein
MPLNKEPSRAAISQNIATEVKAGRKPSQAAAIAFSEARKAGFKDKRKPKKAYGG